MTPLRVASVPLWRHAWRLWSLRALPCPVAPGLAVELKRDEGGFLARLVAQPAEPANPGAPGR